MAGALFLRSGEACRGSELNLAPSSGRRSDLPAWSTLTSDAERRICEDPMGDRASECFPLGGEAKLEFAEEGERWVLSNTMAGMESCEEKEKETD